MKTKIAMSVMVVAAATLFLVGRPAAVTERIVSSENDIRYPLNLECVVTIENEAWMDNPPSKVPGSRSGFLPDFTIQGKLLSVSHDWIVIGEGNYENWIARDKVVNIRASL